MSLGAAQAPATLPGVAPATPAQAEAGRALFIGNCAVCHGETLGGETGPPLTGDAFRSKWAAQPPGALAGFVQAQMPPAAPGSLSADDYAAILAYIGHVNGGSKS